MLDAETGLVIYKRKVLGTVPALSAVDKDNNDYIDTVYFGTTAGRLYKIDLSSVQPLVSVAGLNDIYGVEDSAAQRITAAEWEPFVIFETGGHVPIYHEPISFFVAEIGYHALAFGTGDREDLWNFSTEQGRFYVIVDENFTTAQVSSGRLPIVETDLQEFVPEDSLADPTHDYVLDPTAGSGTERGWYLLLEPSERVITEAFGLGGILIYSSYQPQVIVDDGNRPGDEPICSRTGDSRNFLVFAQNANAVADLNFDTGADRFALVNDFVSSPYVEQAQTKNVGSGTGGHVDDLDPTQEAILNTLKDLYPPYTRFGNYWLSVKQVKGTTGVVTNASIPIGVVLKNWKEN